MKEVEHWYDHEYEEWDRLEHHKVEFDITKMYMDRYILGERLKIFDIGGGPGRYALYLAKKGHRVTLLDLSKKNLEVAKKESKKQNIPLENTVHEDVLRLDQREPEYDVVLLMGPLYHLVREEDRKTALENALRSLRPGGLIVATFISTYAPIQDHLANLYEIEDPQGLLKILRHGENQQDQGFTTAYFSSPEEARGLMQQYPLEELVFAGVENILGSREKEITSLDQEQYHKWMEIAFELSRDQNLLGTSQHFIYIGRKK